MSSRESGSLLGIGGNEEKEGECPILRAFNQGTEEES